MGRANAKSDSKGRDVAAAATADHDIDDEMNDRDDGVGDQGEGDAQQALVQQEQPDQWLSRAVVPTARASREKPKNKNDSDDDDDDDQDQTQAAEEESEDFVTVSQLLGPYNFVASQEVVAATSKSPQGNNVNDGTGGFNRAMRRARDKFAANQGGCGSGGSSPGGLART